MKSQDLGYIRMQKQKDAKHIERLQATLHLTGEEKASKKRRHTIFVDSVEEAEKFDAAKHFDTLPELVGRSFNRPRKETLLKEVLGDEELPATTSTELTADDLRRQIRETQKRAKKLAKARASQYRQVSERVERLEKLQRAESHLVTERLVQGKGRKRKIQAAANGQPAQYKWRRKRLR